MNENASCQRSGAPLYLQLVNFFQIQLLFFEHCMGGCLSDFDKTNSRAISYTQNVSNKSQTSQNTNKSAPAQLAPPLPSVILRPAFPKQLPEPTSSPSLLGQIKPIANEFIEVKVPKDVGSWTEFQWVKEPHYFVPDVISNALALEIKARSFQEKLKWFRVNLEKKRISWTEGKSEYLAVDRENILMSSNSQFERINFYKEVKIVFNDEKETSDAGGLLRQWMSLCIKEIFNPELGLMKLCDCPNTYYKFNCSELAMDLFEVAARILGIVMGKAIFERIPIECPLNYTILRQLCGQPIQMNDVFTYDRDFYNGWKFMIENSMTTMLEQNFCVYEFDEHGTQNTVELKPNGFNVMVNSTNRDEYITLMTEYYCTKSIAKLLENLKYGLYKVIPLELLQVFLPHELDVVLNGRQDINVTDLKENTVYSDCSLSDPVIKWFWEFIFSLNQEKLMRMLHFVTGNGRVPILGFKYLESNRGEYQKFHIKMVEYNAVNPYPKSHTCFNRLELPRYPSLPLFQKYIEYVTIQMMHFGLE